MKIETLTAEERRREIAQLLGRALRRVLERTEASNGTGALKPGHPPSPTCLSSRTEPSSARSSDEEQRQ